MDYITSVFVRGLSNSEVSSGWSHIWYQAPNTTVPGLGAADRFDVYVMKMANPWLADTQVRIHALQHVVSLCCYESNISRGSVPEQFSTLASLEQFRTRYSQLDYETGVSYNGEIRITYRNGWNVGTR